MSIASRITSMEQHIGNAYDKLEDLGIDLTNVDKNLNNIAELLDGVYEDYPKIEENDATEPSINNTKAGKMEIDLKGNTEQTTYTGKNLLNIINTGETKNGITYTKNSDGTITVVGTASADTTIRLIPAASSSISIEANQSYYLYSSQAYNSTTFNMSIIMNIDGSVKYLTANNIYTPTGVPSSVSLDLYIPNGTTMNVKNVKLMLGKGNSVDTSYEPYTGGTASPNPDYPQEVEVVSGENTITISNKNLFNIPNKSGNRGSNTITANNQEIIMNSIDHGTEMAFYLNDVSQVSQYADSNYSTAKDYNMTKLGGTYTLTIYFSYRPIKMIQIYLFTNKRLIMKRTDLDSHYNNGAIEFNIILNNDEYIKSVQAYMGTQEFLNNLMIKAQLEKNSSKTEYQLYQAKKYSINLGNIELCKIGDYQDYIYKNNDSWYLHKEIGKVILDGSNDESWAISATNTSGYNRFTFSSIYNLIKKPTGSSQITDICSNYFIKKSADNTYSRIEGISVGTNGNLYIYADISKEYTLEQFKTWLSTHNTIVYYMLAIPTDIEITDTTLISQLNALEKAKSYDNVTNIIQENNDLPFILDIKTLKKS